MLSFADEVPIIISNDESVVLTTHRLLHLTKKIDKEILLKDYVSHEIVYRKYSYNLYVAVALAAISLVLFLMHDGLAMQIAFLLLFVAALSGLMYYYYPQRFLKISSNSDEIVFDIHGLSTKSYDYFILELVSHSRVRKKEI